MSLPGELPEELYEIIELIEFKNKGPPDEADISDIWIAGHPIGMMLEKTTERSKQNADRIKALQNGGLGANDILEGVDTEALPPIQQLYLTVQAGNEDTLSDNQRRAAKVWPYFREYADKSYGGLSLTSGKVRDIFQRELDEEPDKPHSNTIIRVMENLEGFSDGLIEFDRETNPNRLIADIDDWETMIEQVKEGMSEQSANDSVSPETGQDEAPSGTTPKDDTIPTVGDSGVEVGRQ